MLNESPSGARRVFVLEFQVDVGVIAGHASTTQSLLPAEPLQSGDRVISVDVPPAPGFSSDVAVSARIDTNFNPLRMQLVWQNNSAGGVDPPDTLYRVFVARGV